MLASFSEPRGWERERKGDGGSEGERKEEKRKERNKGRRERRKKGGKAQQKKQNLLALLSFNGICKTRTSIILNDFQNEALLTWQKSPSRIFLFLTGKS